MVGILFIQLGLNMIMGNHYVWF